LASRLHSQESWAREAALHERLVDQPRRRLDVRLAHQRESRTAESSADQPCSQSAGDERGLDGKVERVGADLKIDIQRRMRAIKRLADVDKPFMRWSGSIEFGND